MPEEAHPATDVIRRRWSDLAAEYPFQWVAATADDIASHGPELDGVIRDVIEQNLVGQVAFAYLNVGRLER